MTKNLLSSNDIGQSLPSNARLPLCKKIAVEPKHLKVPKTLTTNASTPWSPGHLCIYQTVTTSLGGGKSAEAIHPQGHVLDVLRTVPCNRTMIETRIGMKWNE